MKMVSILRGALSFAPLLLVGCGSTIASEHLTDGAVPADATGVDVSSGDSAAPDEGGSPATCATGDAGAGGPIPRAAYATTYADAWCTALSGCCGQASYPYDPAGCRALTAQNWSAKASQAEQQGLTYDAQAARACIDALVGELCACDPNLVAEPQDDRQIALCNRVFAGSKADGAACAADSECAQQPGMIAICVGALNDAGVCTGGTCQNVPPGTSVESFPHGKPGDTCGEDCYWGVILSACSGPGPGSAIGCHGSLKGCWDTDGLYCDQVAMKCAAIPTSAGTDCSSSGRCTKGVFCLQSTASDGGTSNTCAPTHATGPCDPNQNGECGDTAYCSTTLPDGGTVGDGGGDCMPIKPVGQPCVSPNECQGGNCAGDADGGMSCHVSSFADPVMCSGNPDAGFIVPARRDHRSPSPRSLLVQDPELHVVRAL